MADYLQALNRDANGIKTSARYDTDNNTWMHDSALYHKSAGGIWVPTGAANPLPSTVTGSLPAFAAIPTVKIDQTTPGTTNAVNPVTSAGAQVTGATGAALPAGAIQVGGTDGTNLRPATMVQQGVNPADAAYMVGVVDVMVGNTGWFRKANAAGTADATTGSNVPASAALLSNDVTFDKERNNTEVTVLASAARTASVNSAGFTVYNGAMLAVFLDVTAASGTSPTLDVTVKVKDVASGKYFVIGTFTQATAATNQALFIGGGADVEFATRTYRVEAVIGGTSPSFTFSVGAAATVA